jgi:hypothetical protein
MVWYAESGRCRGNSKFDGLGSVKTSNETETAALRFCSMEMKLERGPSLTRCRPSLVRIRQSASSSRVSSFTTTLFLSFSSFSPLHPPQPCICGSTISSLSSLFFPFSLLAFYLQLHLAVSFISSPPSFTLPLDFVSSLLSASILRPIGYSYLVV